MCSAGLKGAVTLRDDLGLRLQSIIGPGISIERELGGGGMSRVFLARDTALDRRIVVKVLPPDLAGAVSIDRFKREIQVAARLQHPHIVPVLTAASAGDILYYTMPFVDGESLGTRIARTGALPTSDCIAILRDAVRALAYAHRHDVVHRDIKPDNILLSEDSALIADFGIAKAVSAAAGTGHGLTTVGVSVGTPAYMAPEQSVGDPSVDHRADIYALGAVAYEMLTGRHPFAGRTPQQMMAAHVMETPPSLISSVPAVPEALARVVMLCLEKDPLKRPQSADELLQHLDAATTLASGATATIPARRKQRLKVAGAMALVAVLLVVGGAIAFVPRDQIAIGMALMRRSPATLVPNRIIVTPFENETGDPKLGSLGAMAADWLAQGLTSIGGIEVVDARTTLATGEVVDRIPWPFKSRDRQKALAQEAGAGIVVSGRIYRDGDSLRIQANLNDAKSGKLLRALTTVSGPVSAPTKVLDLLNRRAIANVAQAMDTVASGLGTYSEPPSLEAYGEARKGIEAYFRQDTSVHSHFERAIALDSTYATPVVLLAFSRLYRGHNELAETAVKRAQGLRDRMAPGDRTMLAHVEAQLRGDPDASLRTSEEFMRATPGSAESPLLVASTALATGRPRLALSVLKDVDPDRGLNLAGAFYWFYRAGALNETGQHKEALDVANLGLRRFPKNSSLIYIKGESLLHLGQLAELDDLIENAPPGQAAQIVAQARRASHFATVFRTVGLEAQATRLASDWLPRVRAAPDTSRAARLARLSLLNSLGRWSEARPLVQNEIPRVQNNVNLRRHLLSIAAVIAANMGDRSAAEKIEAQLISETDRFNHGSIKLMRARIAAHLGERDRAVGLLQQALSEGVNLTIPHNIFQHDPLLLPLNGFPPFMELLKPVG